jgi:hypothetical protein
LIQLDQGFGLQLLQLYLVIQIHLKDLDGFHGYEKATTMALMIEVYG